MLTIEQVLKIQHHAEMLLAKCPPELFGDILSIIDVTEPLVKAHEAFNGFTWTEEADESHTMTHKGKKMGRVYPVTHKGHDVYKGVVLHAYDQDSDSDETFVCHNGFLDYAKMDVEYFVKDLLKARELEVAHV